jgi:hypothetical protein
MTRPKVVQFVHPGFEYQKREHIGPRTQRSGIMPWKDGGSIHDRKFMWHTGSALDVNSNQEHVGVPLTFWGEWEGPSIFWKIDSPGKPLASVLHAPFRPSVAPTRSVQNTDPMVFGEAFIYSNCRQAHRPVLRALPEGSIILFGRLGRKDYEERSHFFALDTCLVVERVQRLPARPFDASSYGSDIVEDAALCALYTEGARGDLGVHSGRTRRQGEVFSFFPTQVSHDARSLFARPELRPEGLLADVISPGTQGINVTHDLSDADRDAIWKAVVKQVSDEDCALGYHALEPPLLSDDEALNLAQGQPRPIAISSQAIAGVRS